ncbi:MAG TPA: multidrug efflux SMR transporter [Nocardia sp.]|uniref:DMT family transporter n=1 Tax=Nocardia TaxID=1817 RepID=UPI0024558F62|nr:MULTISPECIES: multidrug efflux SMR transporter [Nocardia]HLS78492.1 multidrug efflux SMR transporter [Nocardia sp.]
MSAGRRGAPTRRAVIRLPAMSLLFLALAIAFEVTATVSLKLSEGFSRLGPSVVVVIGYCGAFYFLSQALKRGMAIGVAYGIWSAIGVAAIAIIGVLLLGEKLTMIQVGGIALVILGVMALELGGAH